MNRPEVHIVRLEHGRGLPLPTYATAGAAGFDLRAALPGPIKLSPGARAAVPTGVAMAIPEGYEGQVRSRSGFALRDGITVLNAPGTVDSDYRGEIRVILANLGDAAVTIHPGDRIAQLVVAPVSQAVIVESTILPETARAAGGFGSTGVA